MDPNTNPNQNSAGQGTGQQGGQGPLKVNLPDAVKPGTYSNAVSVNVNSNEVVVDFGYLLPNTQDPEIEVVSRVNMNHKTAESFINVLSGAMEDFKKKQAAADAAAAGAPAPAAPMPAPAAPGAPVAPAAPMPPQPPTPPMPAPPMPPLPNQ
jgi:hypothetical protein